MQDMMVHVCLRGFALTVKGRYFRGRKAVPTLRNGDPGLPEEAPTFEIVEVYPYGSQEDIFEFFDDLYFRSTTFRDGQPFYTLALDELEDACIEKIEEA